MKLNKMRNKMEKKLKCYATSHATPSIAIQTKHKKHIDREDI